MSTASCESCHESLLVSIAWMSSHREKVPKHVTHALLSPNSIRMESLANSSKYSRHYQAWFSGGPLFSAVSCCHSRWLGQAITAIVALRIVQRQSRPCSRPMTTPSRARGSSMQAEEVASLAERPASSLRVRMLASGPGTTLYSTQHPRGASDRAHTASSSSDPGDTAPKVIDTMHARTQMHAASRLPGLMIRCVGCFQMTMGHRQCCRLARGLVSTPAQYSCIPAQWLPRQQADLALCNPTTSCAPLDAVPPPQGISTSFRRRLTVYTDCACRPQRDMPFGQFSSRQREPAARRCWSGRGSAASRWYSGQFGWVCPTDAFLGADAWPVLSSACCAQTRWSPLSSLHGGRLAMSLRSWCAY